MGTLDLWFEDNLILCNLYVAKEEGGVAHAKK